MTLVRRISSAIALAVAYWCHAKRGRTVTSTDLLIVWDDRYTDPVHRLCSFAPEPPDGGEWDEYGHRDDEVFYYLAGIGEVVRYTITTHDDGWRIVGGSFYWLD